MRHRKRIGSGDKQGWEYKDSESGPVTAPRGARPGLESSRAGLLKCLARNPGVSRLVGLVR